MKPMIYGTYPRDTDIEKAIREIDRMTIAEMLDAGFHGIPGNGNACPIAHGLQKLLSWQWVIVGYTHVSVISDDDTSYDYLDYAVLDLRNVDVPKSLQRFIIDFDGLAYPELEIHPVLMEE